MIVMIDNYDSFTYNLVQYLRQLGEEIRVFRNNVFTIEELEKLDMAGIVISPGPGNPESAGLSIPVIRHFSEKCLFSGSASGTSLLLQLLAVRLYLQKKSCMEKHPW